MLLSEQVIILYYIMHFWVSRWFLGQLYICIYILSDVSSSAKAWFKRKKRLAVVPESLAQPISLLCCHLARDYSRCSAQDNASNVSINQKCLYVGHEAQMEADDTVMVAGRNVWESTQVISFSVAATTIFATDCWFL